MIRTIYKVENQNKNVINTRRVERTLKLIVYLNNEWRTIKECYQLLGVSDKSIQRYFKMLVQLGFDVEKTYFRKSKYRITNVDGFFKKDKIEDNITI